MCFHFFEGLDFEEVDKKFLWVITPTIDFDSEIARTAGELTKNTRSYSKKDRGEVNKQLSKNMPVNPYVSLLKRSWRYATLERSRFLLTYGLLICSNFCKAAIPLCYGWLIASIANDGINVISYAWKYVAVYGLIQLLDWSFLGPARVMERRLAFIISRNLMQELFHYLLLLPIGWHNRHHSAGLISRVRKSYSGLRDFVQNGFMYIQTCVQFCIAFGMMLFFSPLFGLLAMGLGIINVIVIAQFDKVIVKNIDEINEKEHVVFSKLADSLSNILTIITLRLDKSFQGILSKKLEGLFVPFYKNIKINEWKWFAASMLIVVIYCVMIIGYVYHHDIHEAFYIGGLVALIGFVNQFTSAFNGMANLYNEIMQLNADVLTSDNIIRAYAMEHRPETGETVYRDWSEIELSALTFRYASSDLEPGQGVRFAGLENICLRFKKGERIAIVGISGSGKSTLMSLLRGLYVPSERPRILVDGNEQMGWSSFVNQVMLFPQEPEIFENTILYNITLGLPYRMEEVLAACKITQFIEVVDNLEKGFETVIQERGVNLSGGQRQRLALTRGLLASQDSTIWLFDEPTNRVDSETESQIYRLLFDSFRDRTLVVAVHNLSLLKNFDYVYVMGGGRIINQGIPSNLKSIIPTYFSK